MSLDIDISKQFTKRAPHFKGVVFTVIDELTTTNRAGEVVKTEWLCTHDFFGQQVKSRECGTTVKMGLIE